MDALRGRVRKYVPHAGLLSVSGLFLARVIDRDWLRYLDRKVVHFLYFYVLWVTIQFAFKAPGFLAEMGAAGVVREHLLVLSSLRREAAQPPSLEG